ncbi:Head binding [Klebsiella pneumoniae]|nr:Head binding [Klebsiella pneumoniae]
MSDITANAIVSMPSQLFTMARSFKANANGKIYIGQIDTDPVTVENQIPVYVENEDGTRVEVPQPIIIGPGGLPVHNGQISTFVTAQSHSMAIFDARGVQQFYYSNVNGAAWRAEGNVKGWGAIGDGVADDTSAINNGSSAIASSGGGVLRWPSGSYKFTFTKPPYGVTWKMDGPEIKREDLGGSPGAVFQTAKLMYLPGPHPTTQLHAEHIRAISKGSNAIGAPYADYALGLTIEKENWSEKNGAPTAGEINGLMIITRNGCQTGDPVKTGGAAILSDIGQTEGSGYTQFAEIVNSVFYKGTLAVKKQTNMQLLGIDEKTGDSWGVILNSKSGSQSGCMRLVGTDAAPWNYILQNWKNGAHVYYINDLGKHRWRINGVSMSLEQDSTTGSMVFRNENGVVVESISPGGQASLRAVNVQPVTAYTINLAEITGDLNKTLVMASASTITVTLPANAPLGFHCEVIQRDPGQVAFLAAAGATLQNVDGHTKTKGQHAVVRLRVRGNGNGSSAIWVLDGSTGP